MGSATSDGTETIEAYLGLGYTTLKTMRHDGRRCRRHQADFPDARLRSRATRLSDTLDAQRLVHPERAELAIDATALTAEDGRGLHEVGRGTIGLGSATSQGTETIEATDAIGFTTLTSKAGDVDVTSDTASIAGGSLTANGSASLTSATSNVGATVTATTSSVTLAAGAALASPSAFGVFDRLVDGQCRNVCDGVEQGARVDVGFG